MTLFAEPKLERRITGDFRAYVVLTGDPPMPDRKDGKLGPRVPQFFAKEEAARRLLLEGLHILVPAPENMLPICTLKNQPRYSSFSLT